jgi:hypothetical protein
MTDDQKVLVMLTVIEEALEVLQGRLRGKRFG